jgi:hypothetical protein
MAPVDITLADRVKRYASLHRQPISFIIRDVLTLLMEEYPSGADLSGPIVSPHPNFCLTDMSPPGYAYWGDGQRRARSLVG